MENLKKAKATKAPQADRKSLIGAFTLITLLTLLTSPLANAALTITATEIPDGTVVFATNGGTIDLSAWTRGANANVATAIIPSAGLIQMAFQDVAVYGSPQNFSGPTSFGTGGQSTALSLGVDGAQIGIEPDPNGPSLIVRPNYASNDPIPPGSMVFSGTYESLGLAPGSYTWSWGSGDTADSLTLNIEQTAPPIPPPSIGDLVFEDLNGNGLQDAGEPGIDGVEVVLEDADGNIVATAFTAGGGFYEFTGLIPGLQYRVSFSIPNGYTSFSPQVIAYTSYDLRVYDNCPDPCPDFFNLIGEAIDVVTGDFDGDGLQDLFSINEFIPGQDFDSRPPEGPTASLLIGDGNGGFAAPIIISIGGDDRDPVPSLVAAGDFDKDGTDDIVVGYGDGTAKLFLGGTLTVFPEDSTERKFSYGTFDLSASFDTAPNARDPLTEDVNNDGYPDLVVRNLQTDIRVLLNDPAGGFETPIIISDYVDTASGYTDRLDGIALGDLNADGNMDLLVGTSTTTPEANGDPDLLSVSVLLGNGDGTFGPPSTTVVADYQDEPNNAGSAIFLRSIGAGDLNGDGKIDAVVSTFGGVPAPGASDDPQNSLVVALGDGAGGFTNIVTTYTGPNAIGTIDENYVTVADLNNDGYPDVVSSAGRVYFGDRTGGFDYSNNVPGTQRLFRNSDAKYPTLVTNFNGDRSVDLVNLTKVGFLQLGVVLGTTAMDSVGPDGVIVILKPGEHNDTIDAGFVQISVDFEKYVNGHPANDPGFPLQLTVGDEVAYTYEFTNTGNFDLGTAAYPIVLQDDNGTPTDTSDDHTFSVANGVITTSWANPLFDGDDNFDKLLNPGETWTIGADLQHAIGGIVTNTATITIADVEIAKDTASYQGKSSSTAAVIDWKPGSNPSAINLSSGGTTPVAVLGSDIFDVTGIDLSTLRANNELVTIGGVPVAQRGRKLMASYKDANGDGILDLVVHFETEDLGDLFANGDDGTLYLLGENGGTPFVGTQQAHDPLKLIFN